jgi:hypothetical protein
VQSCPVDLDPKQVVRLVRAVALRRRSATAELSPITANSPSKMRSAIDASLRELILINVDFRSVISFGR